MGKAVSSVASAVAKPVGSLFGGVAQGAGLTVDSPEAVSLNPENFKLSQAEKDFEAELKKRYLGEGPSVAQNALKQATDRNVAQLYATAAAQRTNQALVQRELLKQQAFANQDAANQSAQLRAQEMNAASAQYGDIVQRPRLAAQEMEATRAGINRGNQQANLQAQTANAQTMAGLYSGVGQAVAMSSKEMKTNIQPMTSGSSTEAAKPETEEEKAKKRRESIAKSFEDSTAGSPHADAGRKAAVGMSQLGTGVAKQFDSSDKSKKKNIEPGKDFINKLTGYTFDYKDPTAPGARPGRQMGVMAQDLEKSEIGKQMVIDTPHGKMVDFSKAIAPMLATQATMNKEMEELKKALEVRKKKSEKKEA